MSESQLDYLAKTVEILSAENAKLREELAAWKASAIEREALCIKMETELPKVIAQLEAAEDRIKAAEEQKPWTHVRMKDGQPDWSEDCFGDTSGILDGYDEDDSYTAMPLYAAPIPPADVQELQRLMTFWKTAAQESSDEIVEQDARIAELERKLAEQQRELEGWKEECATAKECLRIAKCDIDMRKSHTDSNVWYWQADGTDCLDSMGRTMVVVVYAGDLRVLLAAEYQRGRAEERAEAEKEKPFDADNPKFMEVLLDTLRGINLPVTRRGAGFRSPYTQGCLEVSFEVVNRLNLYTRPLAAQKPLSDEIAKVLHYPDCWDTAAYPTLLDAVTEIANCSVCADPEAHGITEKKEG